MISIKELGLLRDDIRVQLDTLTPNEFNKAFVQYFNLNVSLHFLVHHFFSGE